LAVEFHARALRIEPNYVDGINSLGAALQMTKKLNDARACYQHALAIKPDHVTAHFNYATLLQEDGDYGQAIEHYEFVLQNRPKHTETLAALGALRLIKGDAVGARQLFDRVLEISPDDGEARFNRGCLLLSFGEFEQGWIDYEYRHKTRYTKNRGFSVPAWRGEMLHGETVLLHAEYGFGDVLQFIRYYDLLKARGAKVIVEVHPKLIPILKQSGFESLYPECTPLPAYDLHVPLMSLPAVFNTNYATVPMEVPYLFAAPERVEK
jgi:tetratricopeptide (TPR) repeat protein